MEQTHNYKVNDKAILQIIIKTLQNTMSIKEIIIFIDDFYF